MTRALDLFECLADVVEIESGARLERTRTNDEWPGPIEVSPRRKSEPKEMIDRLLERSPGSLHLCIDPGRNIVVDCNRRTHIMMLLSKHHDVNWESPNRSLDSVTRS